MRAQVQTIEVKEAILDATDRLLARYGYKKMTIDDIAQEVGIGKGSIYLHFTSKDEIALSHIDRIVRRLKENLADIAANSGSADEKLRRMLIERVLFRFDSVQHYTLSLNDLLANLRPQLLTRRKTYFEEEAKIFASVIENGQQIGTFAPGNVREIADAMLIATNSLLPYSLSTQELGAREDIEKKVRRLADLLLQGAMQRKN